MDTDSDEDMAGHDGTTWTQAGKVASDLGQWRRCGGDVMADVIADVRERRVVLGFPAPPLSPSGIGGGASEHPRQSTHGRGTARKPPIPRTLTSGVLWAESTRPPLDLAHWGTDSWRGDLGSMQLWSGSLPYLK